MLGSGSTRTLSPPTVLPISRSFAALVLVAATGMLVKTRAPSRPAEAADDEQAARLCACRPGIWRGRARIDRAAARSRSGATGTPTTSDIGPQGRLVSEAKS